jgi:DNA-binding CsgD family transcriptional regulator/tetratricopeptide (TPR) repeat protein
MKRKSGRHLTSLKKEGSHRKRVFTLLKKADTLLRSDPQQSRLLALQSVEIAKTSNFPDLIAESLFMVGTSFFLGSQLSNARKYYEQALEIHKGLGDIDAVLDIEYGLATARQSAGHEKENIVRLHQVLHSRTITPIQKTKAEIPESRFFIPRMWEDRVLRRIPTPQVVQKNQQIKIAALYNSLGWGYFLIGEYHKSASYLEQQLAISIIQKDRILTASTMNNLSAVYTRLGNMEVARTNAQNALKLNRQLGNAISIAINQHNLANIYFETGHLRLGTRLGAKAYRDYVSLKLWEKAGEVLILRAKWELLHGSLNKAAQLNERARHLLKDGLEDELFFKGELQKLLIGHKKDPSRAIIHTLAALHKRAKRKKLEVQHEIAKELAHLAQELHMQREAIYWLKTVHAHEIELKESQQKNAIVGLEIEKALERAEKERELSKLKMEKLESELKVKAHETELLAVQLAKKGSVLADLSDQLAAMKSTNAEYSAPTINAVIKIIDTIRFRNKEYEHLEERAGVLHRDFMVSISERFPKLTNTENKVCVLLRLGLSPIDIAHVLFTSVRTIETHCLNIRKKMRIPKATRLVKYLSDLNREMSST